ncbi:hypothetical protein Scep_004536 [Stephania cephalantha]|uniref:Uncharacterized protein n=1 Tax=Stephania cephalantha TaxID=152367 RepID=A0AAP0KSM6_9MAGN
MDSPDLYTQSLLDKSHVCTVVRNVIAQINDIHTLHRMIEPLKIGQKKIEQLKIRQRKVKSI